MANNKKKLKGKKKAEQAQNGQSNQAESAVNPIDDLSQAPETLNTTNGTTNAENDTPNATNGTSNTEGDTSNVTNTSSNAANGTSNTASGTLNAINNTSKAKKDESNVTNKTKSDFDSTCRACNRTVEGAWLVQCDHCDNFYHYECVGYKHVHADEPWSCGICIQKVLSSTTQDQEASKPNDEGHNENRENEVSRTENAVGRQGQSERMSSHEISTETRRLSTRISARNEYVNETAKLRLEYMRRFDELTASYGKRNTTQSLPDVDKVGRNSHKQSTVAAEGVNEASNNVGTDTKKAESESALSRNANSRQRNKENPADERVSIRTGTTYRTNVSKIHSIPSHSSKASSHRFREIELQRLQEECDLEKKIEEEKLALERKAIDAKEKRARKLLDAKYRAMEDNISVRSVSKTSRKSIQESESAIRTGTMTDWIKKQVEMVHSNKYVKPLDLLPPDVDETNVNTMESINVSIPVDKQERQQIKQQMLSRLADTQNVIPEYGNVNFETQHSEPPEMQRDVNGQGAHNDNKQKAVSSTRDDSPSSSNMSKHDNGRLHDQTLVKNPRLSWNFEEQGGKQSTHVQESNFNHITSEHRGKYGNRNDEFTSYKDRDTYSSSNKGDEENRTFTIPIKHLPNGQSSSRSDGKGKQQVPVNLTPNQIAARHTIGKEGLPFFYGHPKDWIQFIKTYEDTTTLCGFTDTENLSRLRKGLKGKAYVLVESLLFMPECVEQIIAMLRGKYGKPELIAQAALDKIRSMPPIKSDKLEVLADFGYQVNNACNVIESMGMQFYLYDPDLVREVVAKLPSQIKLDWAKHAKKLQSTEAHVNFKMIASWLLDLSETLNLVTCLDLDSMQSDQNAQRKADGKAGIVHYHDKSKAEDTNQTVSSTTVKCPSCSNSCKYVGECPKFKGLTVDDRWKLVLRDKLCRKCLRGHTKACTNNNFRSCGVPGCDLKHNTMLHNEKRHAKFNQKKTNSDKSKGDKNDGDSTSGNGTSSGGTSTNAKPNNVHQVDDDEELFRILPVVLHVNGRSKQTFAFFDEGSSYTLMEKHLADELNVAGEPENICLLWTKGIHRQEESLKVNLEISSLDEINVKHKLHSVNVVEDLGLSAQTIDPYGLAERFKYLKGLPLPKYRNAIPTILIGLRHIRLTTPLETIEGSENEPIASRSRLGWTVYGPIVQKGRTGSVNHHVVSKCPCSDRDERDDLHKIVKDHFSIENFGVNVNSMDMESEENRKALEMLKNFTIRKGDRFETRLLWKNESYILPDSYPMARKRLACLENKGAEVVKIINEIISDYLDKGYATKLSPAELQKQHPRTFYLPIFTVTNPKKPGKIRPVFDAAATVNGTSLNSALLTGPDLLSPLVDVLRRFRQHRIAVTGDIKEMFYRVLVNEIDRHSQRFLWRNGDRNREPDIYEFNVMTFGSKCSPTAAQFVKNINAEEYKIEFPEAYDSIVKNHYVDDMLDGADTTEAAIKLINDVKHVHSRAGFEIRNFKSNSREVLNAIGETPDSKQVILAEDKIERVLGMFWDTESDCFQFSLKYTKLTPAILQGKTLPTKRQVLSLTMSLFDPLGLISYYTIHARILMQNVWKTEIGWDDKIPESLADNWYRWIKLLSGVESLKIPRWYSTKLGTESRSSTELHIFVDAGEDAYAAAAYLRISNTEGTECSLVGSKARVSPLKYLSNTRKELSAAVLGSRLVNSVKDGLSLKIERKIIWSDSTTVLTWLHSEHRRYSQFVAHRVGEILESTDLTEWRWVPTKLNVADEATKWGKIPTFDASSRWFIGPEFLKQPEAEWPLQKIIIPNGTTEEMRASFSHSRLIMPSIVDATKFSTWQRLIKAVANAKRIAALMIAKLRKQTLPSLKLSQRDLMESERKLIRQAQWENFTEEMTILTRNQIMDKNRQKPIDAGSSIKDCSPYLDEFGILRVKGRIDSATAVTEDAKRPIILPKDNAVTKLIVFSYHQKFQHRNHESVVNEMRQKFYIPKIRTVLKSVRWSCKLCTLRRCKPRNPQMADLPPIRFEAGIRPFTYTGIDYFGPFKVKVGRQYPKRWGIIYTCLTVRAVWIDVVPSYDTEACILSIRDFINRNGVVQTFYTDNGSNFKGADNELTREMKKIDFERLSDEFTSCYTKWKFNPPEAPHMGGIWERLVASVKVSLYDAMTTRTPTDQMLRSWLIEAENIINSRPLTFVPVESEDDEALTPNHFMLGSSNGLKPPGDFKADGQYLRRQWKEVQRCTDIFWKRFIKEYCPTLVRKTKWFEKVKPLEVGDIVINFDENAPRNTYKRARVVETIIGTNDQVRRAKVQFPNGSTLWRPVNRLGLLDVSPNAPTKEVLGHLKDVKNEGENVGARISTERPLSEKKVEVSMSCSN